MNDIDVLEGIDLALAVARAQGLELVEWQAAGDWHVVTRHPSGVETLTPLPRPDSDLNAALALPSKYTLNIHVTPDGLAKANYDPIWSDLPPAKPATAVSRAWLIMMEVEAAREQHLDHLDDLRGRGI